jgi:hypothetical protein
LPFRSEKRERRKEREEYGWWVSGRDMVVGDIEERLDAFLGKQC